LLKPLEKRFYRKHRFLKANWYQQKEFVSLLHSHADESSLRAYIENTEAEWGDNP
jgi:hypothetical protein